MKKKPVNSNTRKETTAGILTKMITNIIAGEDTRKLERVLSKSGVKIKKF